MDVRMLRAVFAIAGFGLLGACVMPTDMKRVDQYGAGEPILLGSRVTNNTTPYDPLLACFGKQIKNNRPSIAVGDIRDYTGKSNQNEGFAISQGGSLMAYSALGKMKPGVIIHERFDTRIADAELAYMTNRQLGDGTNHEIDEPDGTVSEVPWKPYFGGTVLQSRYYIIGGVTELNYNIQSGGAQFLIQNIGPRSRTYVMNVAVDLRIVDTQSLEVVETVSVQKQLVGYEVGVGLFRFFDDILYDIDAGMKNQEPLQLGVRMAIEDGVLQLVSAVTKKDPTNCLKT